MLRVLFTIVLPLVLPTLIYLLWLRVAHRVHAASQPGEPIRWAALPWVWLMTAGALLVALVLFVVADRFGIPQPGTYVPPRWEDGRIVPGHVEPKPGQ